ncbi:hypothetical protein [Thalassobacillus sp. C254]|uniref:hypothetical protein n=1 Tax=Thalassobacillus sp. C254 TaxID=1225341 RepID=UPI0006D143C9|nr:hypothetical protein [Thalassobacillus sp. C254]
MAAENIDTKEEKTNKLKTKEAHSRKRRKRGKKNQPPLQKRKHLVVRRKRNRTPAKKIQAAGKNLQ